MRRKIFFGYLKKRRFLILLQAAELGLIFLVYSLYNLPWGLAFYTAILIAAMSLGGGILDLREYGKRVRLLAAAEKQAVLYLGELPPARDLLEEQYQHIVKVLEDRCLKSERQKEQALEDAGAYYMLWSHQVKTPLAAMRLLLEEEKPDRALLSQELFKTEQYVEMALQYQRLEKGFDDLVLRRYPLEKLCKEAVKRTAALFIHKKVGIRLGELSMEALTDEKWICFILEQLLTNAVKYTKEGGTVTLSLSEKDPETLVVADTGIGILPEDLPRVFEWGYTGYNGRMDKRSTGIGLALCRQAANLLGHKLAIESAVGKGTKVFLTLSRPNLPIC
ncbi:MAG: HAMP domain-containing histidine kinase [Oscillospiraceae bacterium]|jgi:signal transduction histidine kinase|nr:HAMP domain-containing histidine kinase [Oscillospiraceae bacterium]